MVGNKTGGPDQSHWVKDDFVLECTSCSKAFSMSVRKHHCRSCGEIFCGPCADKYVALARLGYDESPQRVCQSCFTKETMPKNAAEKERTTPEAGLQKETVEGLKRLYRQGIKPLETQFKFGEFYSPLLMDADFDAKPMVLLIGQYSVGKTSFIRYLVERDFPGSRIGPEPTTDGFMIVAGTTQENDSVTPGNALAVDTDKPFRSLQKFGANFLNKLEYSATSESEILQHITFVDTPGILSGEKQRIGRSYDFTAVVEWFAGRCDRILLLFDAHKLDISDEFQAAIGALRGHDDKVRVVLNKADSVDGQQLMRVHGALMWSLGKILKTPEVVRVYIGSFWDKPIQNTEFEALFRKEARDLIEDLRSLPASAVTRKINDVVKRARAAKVHALLIDHLRNKIPYFGKEKALVKMLDNIEEEYKEVHRKHNVPLGDFPRPETFRRAVKAQTGNDLSNFPQLNSRMIVELNEILSSYLPRLNSRHAAAMNKLMGDSAANEANPFKAARNRSGVWAIDPESFEKYSNGFEALDPEDGKLHGANVRDALLETGVPKAKLRKIWDLSDVDNDGALTKEEFAIAMHLINTFALKDVALPNVLPENWLPPQ